MLEGKSPDIENEFAEVFAGLLERRRKAAVSLPLRQALSDVLNALANSELRGGVCVQTSPASRLAESLKVLEDGKLVSDGASLTFDAPFVRSENRPLVADRANTDAGVLRIYSQRAFASEKRLAGCLAALFKEVPDAEEVRKYRLALEELQKAAEAIGPAARALNQGQKKAAFEALGAQFAVISGKPGTGKTTTVVKLLEARLKGRASKEDKKTEIILCAPTGKAQSRLQESVLSQLSKELYPEVKKVSDAGGISSMTIHKLLVTPLANGKRPSADNPLTADILIADEGSMIDSELALSLFSCIDPAQTFTVVLGDKNQLAAVGPGSVFADISDESGPLAQRAGELTESMRFDEKSAVGRLSGSILGFNPEQKDAYIDFKNRYKAQGALPEFEKGSADIAFETPLAKSHRFFGLTEGSVAWLTAMAERYSTPCLELQEKCRKNYVPVKPGLQFADLCKPVQEGLKKTWKTLSSFRALTAQRKGPMSLSRVNEFFKDLMKQKLGTPASEELYAGRVIIIRKNDSSLGVSNGDTALCFPVYEEELSDAAWFAYVGDIGKIFPVKLLPAFDDAYAITIHQSQGSGFDDVAVFLPAAGAQSSEEAASLCTRELLYTGVTRTQRSCRIFTGDEALLRSLSTVTKRSGGLSQRIKEELAAPKDAGKGWGV